MSIADSIANLIIQQGAIRGQQAQQVADAQARAQVASAQAQAQAQQASGQIWGQTIQHLGQLPLQTFQAVQQQKTAALDQQQKQLQIQRAQQVIAGEKAGQGLWSRILQPDGSLDASGLMKDPAFAQMLPEQQQAFLKQVDDFDTIHQKFTQQRTDHAAQIADTALKAAQQSGQPLSVLGASLWLNSAAQSGIATPDDVKKIQTGLVAGADPTKLFQTIRAQGSQFKPKPTIVPAGGSVFDETNPSGGALFTAPAEPGKGDYTINGQRFHADGTPIGPPVPKQTEPKTPDQFASFQDAYAANALGIGKPWADLTPEQKLAGIEHFKTITTDASATAAADRLATTIGAQIASQKRGQDFQIAETGRTKYADEVAKPYRAALQSAQTLRDVVEAAKAGNNIAGAMQNLQTAMTMIRDNGLNRINAQEIGAPAAAGSLWQRLQGRLGALTSGASKSVSPDLQRDMVQFADLLEKQATANYRKGRSSVLGTYPGVTLPDESSGGATGGPGQPVQVGGFTIRVK